VKSLKPLSPRVFAILVLVIVGCIYVALLKPVAWLVDAGYLRPGRGRGLQAIPLYFIPYFVIQLATGLTFDQICDGWQRLSSLLKVVAAVVLACTVAAVVFVYLTFLA
jgi:hypothetical protein